MEAIDIVLEGAIKLGVNKKGQSELIKFVLDNPKYHYSIVTNHRNLTHIMHDISGLMRDDEFFVPRVLFDDDNEYKKIEQMKDNKLIAEFMGMTAHHQDKGCMIFMTPQGHNDIVYVTDLEYHKSWDWLMPVVEKIEDMGCEIVITNGECTISGSNDYYKKSIGKSRRDTTYKAIVEFINEYNKK